MWLNPGLQGAWTMNYKQREGKRPSVQLSTDVKLDVCSVM